MSARTFVTSIIIILIALAVFQLLLVRSPSIAMVAPNEQGLLLKNGQVEQVLSPGQYRFKSRGQEIVVYQTLNERPIELTSKIDVANCRAAVSAYYNIRDVKAWHAAYDRDTVGSKFAQEIVKLAEGLTEFGDDPRTEMQVYLYNQLDGMLISGAGITALIVNRDECDAALE